MSGRADATAARFAYFGPKDIRRAVGFGDVVEPVARALIDHSRGLGASPVAIFAPAGRDGDVHVKSAWLPGRSIFTVKVATWFAARAERGDPAGGGIIAAFDSRTGDLKALLEDDHHLSDIRTAAAGALSARLLARPQASVLGVVGTGVQAYLQALAAMAERPITSVRAWGRTAANTERLLQAIGRHRPDLCLAIASSPREVCVDADLIVTATASTEPLIQVDWLAPGVHITAVGADDAAKCELAPECFQRADRIVVDSRALAADLGDISRALRSGALANLDQVHELGELLPEGGLVRAPSDRLTICKLIGLGVQDLAAAEVTLDRLENGRLPVRPPACVLDLGVARQTNIY